MFMILKHVERCPGKLKDRLSLNKIEWFGYKLERFEWKKKFFDRTQTN
jgi:hypothetical protein